MEEAVTLISPTPPPPSVDALPFDLLEEILSRLPVKFLLRFRCVCKSWNSLITDNPEFAKKHLRFSKTNHRLVLNVVSHSLHTSTQFLVKSYPIKSPFTTSINAATQFRYPPNSYDDGVFSFVNSFNLAIGSCDGILCLHGIDNNGTIILWNPSIGKSRELPPLEKLPSDDTLVSYGFGYDSLSDNYKVLAVYNHLIWESCDDDYDWIPETRVRVHSLGTNSWRIIIQKFPYRSLPSSPQFVSGKLHWWAVIPPNNYGKFFIVSLDLGNESYQEVMQPDYGEEVSLHYLSMGVLNDCFSMLTGTSVWVMKEYGNKESWTKIFSFREEGYVITRAIYIFEDNQVLLHAFPIEELELESNLILYDSKNGIVNFQRIDNSPQHMVDVESLISP